MLKAKKFIIPLVLILIGLTLTIVGSLFKIMHWQFAAEVFIVGNIILVLGLIVTIIKLIGIYKEK